MITLKSGDTVLFTGDSITHGGRGYCMDGNHILGHGYQEIVCGYLAEKISKACRNSSTRAFRAGQ